MTGGLFKYSFLLFFTLLAYLCFIVAVIFGNFIYTNNFSSNFINSYLENIDESQTSLCPTNNVYLFGQEEIICFYYSYQYYDKLQIPYILSNSNHFFKQFLQKKSFYNHKANLALFNIISLCFNCCPPHKLKSKDLKCCPNSEFFSTEVLKTTNHISSTEIRTDLGCFIFFSINFALSIKYA